MKYYSNQWEFKWYLRNNSFSSFWRRNPCNCLLKAIDKASDILMFVLPPNLQKSSFVRTYAASVCPFPLTSSDSFILLLSRFCCYPTCSIVILGSCFSFAVFDTRRLTHTYIAYTDHASLRRFPSMSGCKNVHFYAIPLLMFVLWEEKMC